MFEIAELLQQLAWVAIALGLALVALGGLLLLLTWLGEGRRARRGWRAWVEARAFTVALVLLLAAALMQVVAHRGLSERPDGAPREESPAVAETTTETAPPPASPEREAAEAAFREALAARAEGRGEDAEAAYRRARTAFAALGDARREADAAHGVGDMAFARRDPAGAGQLYLAARRLYAGLGARVGEANAMVGLARVAAGEGRRAEADRLLTEAHTLYRKAASAQGRANVTLARAGLAADPARARQLYRDAAGLFLRAGLPGWAEHARSLAERDDR